MMPVRPVCDRLMSLILARISYFFGNMKRLIVLHDGLVLTMGGYTFKKKQLVFGWMWIKENH